MEYVYGKQMLEQGDITSLDEWSDDKEKACSIMDCKFDYLWDFSKGIRFVDRLYDSGEKDAEVQARIDRNEHELFFDSFEDVFAWIRKHMPKTEGHDEVDRILSEREEKQC